MLTCGSLFTGGGGADTGLALAGYRPVFGIEYDDAIASVARANGHHVITSGVEDVDYRTMPRVDLLWASPECKEFSRAKIGGQEGETQHGQADAICRAIEALQPPCFVLENVVGYRRSASLARIVATLDRLGYMTDIQHVNAANMGVPQTRVRLILRAVRGGLVPHLPPPVRWVGWYAAIADLLPTLPSSQFAPWQLARLDQLAGVPRAVLIGGGNTQMAQMDSFARESDMPSYTAAAGQQCGHNRAFLVHPTDQRTMRVRDQDDPAWTQTANSGGEGRASGSRARAFIVDQQNGSRDATVRHEVDPIFTTTTYSTKHPPPRAFIVPGGNASSFDVRYEEEPTRTVGDTQRVGNLSRAWLPAGRVVAMTPRAIARFQSFPDSYILPEKKGLALTVLGNAVPCLLAKAIGASLRGVCRQEEVG